MNYADPPVVRITRWAIIAQQDNAGHVIAMFSIHERGEALPSVMLLAVEPYSLQIVRATQVKDTDQRTVPINKVPGHLLDLAKTKVRELYHVGFPAGLV